MGFLPGKRWANTSFDPETDLRADFDRFSEENLAANQPVIDALWKLAEQNRVSPSQIALAWLLAQKPWIVPIPGTRTVNHLHEYLGALNVELTPTDVRELDASFAQMTVHGGRMNEAQMQLVDQT